MFQANGKTHNVTSEAAALAIVIRAAREMARKMRTKRRLSDTEEQEMFDLYRSIERAEDILARLNAQAAGAKVDAPVPTPAK